MSKVGTPQRWFSGWRIASRPARSDPADMGTAFGLELSLFESSQPPVPLAVARRAWWMQLLGARRKPAV